MASDWTQTILIIASILTVSGGLFAWLRNDSKNLRDEFRDDMRLVRGEMGQLRGEVGQLRGEVGQLRGEMGQLRGEMGQLRTDVQGDNRRLEGKIDDGFKALDDRLRAVETEQSRVAGLLEGLGLSGVLPSREG
ncbi:MAG: hypothetical protein OXG84_08010 [Chloroflexi bacterium]|nr:hypothetical protein [Chloroflexota bacterium]